MRHPVSLRRLLTPILLMLALAAPGLAAAAAAATPRWEPLPLFGGNVQVAAAPGAPAVAYAATLAHGLYRSTDGAVSWQLAGPAPNRFRIEILGVDPHSAQRFFVRGFDPYSYRGLYRSDDGGRHWVRSDQGI